jgi:hypothetical protein
MKFKHPLFYLFLFGGGLYASSLSVYQDHTFYTTNLSSHYIGLTKGISAKCEGSTVPLESMKTCPPTQRLCGDLESINTLRQKIRGIDANAKVLAQFTTLPQPTSIDAASFIASAKLIGEEQADLAGKKEQLTKQLKREERAFGKQAPSKEAVGLVSECQGALELTIPYGYVTFTTTYEAELLEDNVKVTQKLSITNRSGVEMEAKNAMFYYRSANQYVQPIHFSPWIVSKYEPRLERKYKSPAVAKSQVMLERAMSADSFVAESMPAPVASYEDAREYKVTNLSLPSTGDPTEVTVLSWQTDAKCELKAYPYATKKVFEVCSFTPKYQIDSNRWKVKSEGEVINENAVGQYSDGRYALYTKIEEDIKVERKPIVKKERESGIFGGTARKKDGYTLTLTNKSGKEKSLVLIDRMPTSTTTEITSKLLSIASNEKVDYELLKDGEIKMPLTLKPNEIKKIDVVFELSYDKELKVNY